MNRRDLVGRVAREACLTRAQAAGALEALVGAIRSSLASGDKVTIAGFGTFVVSHHKQRRVCDPRRGVPMTIRARNVPRFAPGLELRLAVEKAAALSHNHD